MTDDDHVLQVAGTLTGARVSSIERRMGGSNNRLFRVVTADNVSYALKEYPRRAGDTRDRLGAEFDALRFMEQCGINEVPKAIAADRTAGFALYEWIDGTQVTDITDADLDAALVFVTRLHESRDTPGAAELRPASEACLSGAEIAAQVTRRFARLNDAAQAEPRLAEFLSEEYAATADSVTAWSKREYETAGWVFDRPIEVGGRSLSPSDFGFHNAIRRADGRLIFVDFEYFGWDDPAKLTADFLLHPGMRLSSRHYARFRAGAEKIYSSDSTFAARLALVYPLYGLRWCMILLNEFLPERWESRRRAGVRIDRDAATAGQLEKARRQIADVRQYITDHA